MMRRLFLKMLRRRRLHAELEAELEHHRELSKMNGNPIGLGNTVVIKEAALDLWRFALLENSWRDLRYAWRGLRLSPAFTITAVFSLGLGIGVSTVMFSLLNAVAFRALPYHDAERLVWITQVLQANSTDEVTLTPDFLDWRRETRAFTSLAGYNYGTRSMTGVNEPQEVKTAKASATLLTILGVRPFLGRNFSQQEDYAGQDRVALLSHSMWRNQFGSDKTVLGRPIMLDGEAITIVGILPPSFVFPGPEQVQIITPLGKNEAGELSRNGTILTLVRNVIGRLKPGISAEQARMDLTLIQAHLPTPAFHPTITIKMLQLRDHLFGNAKTVGGLLLAASLFFLIIACANVGSLLLVRLLQRDRELAVRRALGGSQNRIFFQLMIEGILLAVLACIAGSAFGYWLRAPLMKLNPYQLSGLESIPFDANVLCFSCGLLCLTILLFGVSPIFGARDVRLSDALKAGQSSIAGTRVTMRALSLIAGCELALVLMLASCAGLMLKSFWLMRYEHLGFQSEHLIAATIKLNQTQYQEKTQQLLFVRQVLARIAAIPGIDEASLTTASEIPPGEGHATSTFRIVGRTVPIDSRQKPLAREQLVEAGYFHLMHIPLLEGRLINSSDAAGTPPVVVVSRELARRTFHDGTALGHQVQNGLGRKSGYTAYTIVGVVGDVKTSGLDASPDPIIYTPYEQTDGIQEIGIVMRSARPAQGIAMEFRKLVQSIDPRQPVADMETLDERLNNAVSRPRFTSDLLFTFSVLAVLLAAIGIYGVMTCRVRSQIRELAVRQALGAEPRDVIAHVIHQGLPILIFGVSGGLLGTLLLSRLLSSVLVGVKATDPATLTSVTAAVVIVALAASVVPAVRASRTDPLVFLRQD